MPNVVLHSVWNTLSSVAVGDNPLYKTSFDEWIGSMGATEWFQSRILQKADEYTKSWLNDISKQVNEAIAEHKCTSYERPLIEPNW